MCDVVLIVAPLAEGLAFAAELEQVLKQDLNLKHNVLKINFFFPGEQINDDDYACSFSQAALPEGQSSARMSIVHGCSYLQWHNVATCRWGADWQRRLVTLLCSREVSCSPI